METYHKIQTLFKRDMDGSLTGQKGKMIPGEWTTPELEYLADKQWEFTEKVDGTNIRIHIRHEDDEFFVSYAGRTDNAQIPDPLMEYLIATFQNESTLRGVNFSEATLYGEGYGPKIQGGGKYRTDHSFVLFDVNIGDFWLDRHNVDDIAMKLGIDSVPVIGHGTLEDAIHLVSGWSYRDSQTGEMYEVPPMRSQWGDFEAEGIVARPAIPLFNRKGERIITKIKVVDFR